MKIEVLIEALEKHAEDHPGCDVVMFDHMDESGVTGSTNFMALTSDDGEAVLLVSREDALENHLA